MVISVMIIATIHTLHALGTILEHGLHALVKKGLAGFIDKLGQFKLAWDTSGFGMSGLGC